MYAGPLTIQSEIPSSTVVKTTRHGCWRRPVLEHLCHSTRTKVVDRRAAQCRACDETVSCIRTLRKGVVRGYQLRAYAADADGISAGANANLVPGGRDFFTCTSLQRSVQQLFPTYVFQSSCKYVMAFIFAHNPALVPHHEVDGGFAGLVDLPWNRVGVWAVVIWFMYSLKDFFGVSCTMTGFPCSVTACA